ncbi:MAG: hypothetical protein HY717_00030 [Planctomycetes bacterium]|nr:hypothetical protein [Planctomycetota bacterium]
MATWMTLFYFSKVSLHLIPRHPNRLGIRGQIPGGYIFHPKCLALGFWRKGRRRLKSTAVMVNCFDSDHTPDKSLMVKLYRRM